MTPRLFGPGHVPHLCVGVLTRGDEAAVVQPRDAGDLALVVGVPHDAVLVRGLHRPQDDGRVQAAAGDIQAVGGPGDAVHLKSWET